MKQKFIDAVDKHNLKKVRMMLADELLLDPRGTSFSEMLEYAKNLVDLFEPNKESNYIISPDRNTWNMELVSKVKQDLISNFSVEKLALFQEIAMEVGKDKAKVLAEEEPTVEEENNERMDSTRTSRSDDTSYDERTSHRTNGAGSMNDRKDKPNKRTMGTISLCGGAALTIIGVCVEGCIVQTLLCLAGGAAIVGGVVLLTKDNKK